MMKIDNNNILVFLIVTTVLILVLGIVLVRLMYIRQRRNFLYQVQMARLKVKYEKNLMEARLEMQEMTFQHVSREIHDNIKNSLTLAKLYMDSLTTAEENESNKKISAAVDMLGKTIDDLGDLSRSFNTDMIKTEGLINTLDAEIEKIRKMGRFEIDINITGTPVFLSSERELLIFRIMQEALSNIVRHAEAKAISILLRYYPDTLEIEIEDDGKGFNVADIPGKRAGINNMRTRAEVLGGDVKISSASGKGSRVFVSVPFEKPGNAISNNKMKAMARFEYGKSSTNGKYNFRLKDSNNKIILHSNQGYESEQGCRKGIDSVRYYAADEDNYVRYQGRDNLYYFTLKAFNGEVIGQSEGYMSASNRDSGIENCKKEAPKASSAEVTAY